MKKYIASVFSVVLLASCSGKTLDTNKVSTEEDMNNKISEFRENLFENNIKQYIPSIPEKSEFDYESEIKLDSPMLGNFYFSGLSKGKTDIKGGIKSSSNSKIKLDYKASGLPFIPVELINAEFDINELVNNKDMFYKFNVVKLLAKYTDFSKQNEDGSFEKKEINTENLDIDFLKNTWFKINFDDYQNKINEITKNNQQFPIDLYDMESLNLLINNIIRDAVKDVRFFKFTKGFKPEDNMMKFEVKFDQDVFKNSVIAVIEKNEELIKFTDEKYKKAFQEMKEEIRDENIDFTFNGVLALSPEKNTFFTLDGVIKDEKNDTEEIKFVLENLENSKKLHIKDLEKENKEILFVSNKEKDTWKYSLNVDGVKALEGECNENSKKFIAYKANKNNEDNPKVADGEFTKDGEKWKGFINTENFGKVFELNNFEHKFSGEHFKILANFDIKNSGALMASINFLTDLKFKKVDNIEIKSPEESKPFEEAYEKVMKIVTSL